MPGPVFGRDGKLKGIRGIGREKGEAGIGQNQVSGVLDHHIVPVQIGMINRKSRQKLGGSLRIVRHHNKLHIPADFPHIFHGVHPVSAFQIQFRISGIFAASHIQNAQIVPGKFMGIVFFLHLKPFFDFFPVPGEIAFRLHVAIDQRVVRQAVQGLVRSGHIAAVLHIVKGSILVKPEFLFLVPAKPV